MNFFVRQAVAFRNDMRRSCGALLGIVQGILADGELNDTEVKFLRDWLRQNESVAACWPGNVVAAQIEAALADGVITPEERHHLSNVLQQLVGGQLDDLATSTHVTELALDAVNGIDFAQRTFCLTGEFCFGSRNACQDAIKARGGEIAVSVTKRLHYLVVGGLGSTEWKHGSFGTKVEKAMKLKAAGCSLLVVHEDPWASALMAR